MVGDEQVQVIAKWTIILRTPMRVLLTFGLRDGAFVIERDDGDGVFHPVDPSRPIWFDSHLKGDNVIIMGRKQASDIREALADLQE